MMKHDQVKKLAIAGILVALGVVGGTLSVPVGFTRCCPMQSVINIISAIFLGPWYAVGTAIGISTIRNLLGTGTIMAFPGSICGALLAGLLYRYRPKLAMACLGEVVGTGVVAAVMAYPIAKFVLGKACGLFTYFVPFTVAAVTGVVIATVLVVLLEKSGALRVMRQSAEKG